MGVRKVVGLPDDQRTPTMLTPAVSDIIDKKCICLHSLGRVLGILTFSPLFHAWAPAKSFVTGDKPKKAPHIEKKPHHMEKGPFIKRKSNPTLKVSLIFQREDQGGTPTLAPPRAPMITCFVPVTYLLYITMGGRLVL